MKIDKTLAAAIKHWDHVAPLVKYPANADEFDRLTAKLDQLLEIVGNDESHPLMSLIDLLSNIISDYEEKRYQHKLGKGIHALKYLMESRGLSQSDLSEIGSQGVVSELLSGRRSLNIRQVKLLARRFKVDPSTFIT